MKLLMLCQLSFVTFFSLSAFCTLGEKVEGLTSTGAQKKLSKTSTNYTVQESEVNGTTIHEYVLPNGTVFGVTWKGLKHPDLSGVLGTYNAEYERLRSQKAKSVGRAPIHVKSDKVSVRMSGHMRDVHGQAYDPKLLPEGFSLEDLK